jgi:protease I
MSISTGEIQAMNGDIDKADRFTVDRPVADASPEDFDALILPGGRPSPHRDSSHSSPPGLKMRHSA